MSKLPTVEETKIQVASEYGSKDYERDYEYGLGISKLMDPFEFMERVCESHTAAHTAALRERVKELEDLFSHLVGLEAWIEDRAMREVFTNVLRKALKK